MKVSRVQAAENRQTVINVASRLFREHGFDGIGIADLMQGAGLTQGGFYKQFASKEDLASQASQRAVEQSLQRWQAVAAAERKDPLAALVRFYLSREHRDSTGEGCPLVALAADAARQGPDVRDVFEAGIKAHLKIMEEVMPVSSGENPRDKSLAVLATMAGALLLSRVVNDEVLSRRILKAATKDVLRNTAATPTA